MKIVFNVYPQIYNLCFRETTFDSMSMERDPMKDDPSVIKVRGLPWEATAMDLCKFFRDCDIVGGPNGIHFCTNDRGQPSGEAFIEMERPEDVEKALEKHKQNMGRRSVELLFNYKQLDSVFFVDMSRCLSLASASWRR